MRRAALHRTHLRRSGQGVRGPLVALDGTIQNANTTTLPDPFVGADIKTDFFNGFIVPDLSANLAMPAPTGKREGRKITFTITQGAGAFTVTWDAMYLFAAVGSQGVTLAQFNALLASMGNGDVTKIGFEYLASKDKWLAVGNPGKFV